MGGSSPSPSYNRTTQLKSNQKRDWLRRIENTPALSHELSKAKNVSLRERHPQIVRAEESKPTRLPFVVSTPSDRKEEHRPKGSFKKDFAG